MSGVLDSRKSEGNCPAKSAVALLFRPPATLMHTRCTGSSALPALAMSSHCVEAGIRTPRSFCILSNR